jgi:hypothetical protein
MKYTLLITVPAVPQVLVEPPECSFSSTEDNKFRQKVSPLSGAFKLPEGILMNRNA